MNTIAYSQRYLPHELNTKFYIFLLNSIISELISPLSDDDYIFQNITVLISTTLQKYSQTKFTKYTI